MSSNTSVTKIVLVAAETPFVRERFKAALEQAGHRVVPIASAGELLARVRFDDTDIDLLIVDLHLSNSIGTGLVAAVRKLNENRLPILVFSGTVSTAEDVRDLARMKVAGYINEHCATQQILPAVAPHLFPDSFNRRGNPRVVLGVPVQYRVDGTIAAALTLNLSHGGWAFAPRARWPLARRCASGSSCQERTAMPKAKGAWRGAIRVWAWASSSSRSTPRLNC